MMGWEPRTLPSPNIPPIRVYTGVTSFEADCPILVYTEGSEIGTASDPASTRGTRVGSEV